MSSNEKLRSCLNATIFLGCARKKSLSDVQFWKIIWHSLIKSQVHETLALEIYSSSSHQLHTIFKITISTIMHVDGIPWYFVTNVQVIKSPHFQNWFYNYLSLHTMLLPTMSMTSLTPYPCCGIGSQFIFQQISCETE